MNTNNTTLETNILIAEFMGLEFNVNFALNMWYSNIPIDNHRVHEQLKYHSSWNWLIEAVHRCLEICHDKMLNEWEQSFIDAFLSLDIVQMYSEVIDFVKWFNENSAEKD